MEMKFEWDGEKIKQTVKQSENKLTPKDLIDSLNHVRSQINQMEQQKQQMEQQKKQAEKNLLSAKDFEKSIKPFEEDCNRLQLEKLKHLIGIISEECKVKAATDAKEIIERDPAAHTEEQKRMMPYLNYQKLLATHPKVAEKISRQIITEHLYNKPVFENPFKD